MKLETSEDERKELSVDCRDGTAGHHMPEYTIWGTIARLLRDIDTLLAEVDRLRKEYELAGEQINELETEEEASSAEIARLRAELDAAAPDESADDIAYEIAETAWKDFGATEEARYPRARLEAAIRKALAERAPPLPTEVEEMRKAVSAALLRAAVHSTNIADFGSANYFYRVRDDAASLLSRWPGVWRPMETAPRDEPCILENAEGWVGEAWFSENADGWWMVNTHPIDAHDGQVLNPTGWMPLPAPGAAP